MFIVFEGTDGSGTTTQGDLLSEALRQRGREVLRTAEPTTGDIGAFLRRALRGQLDRRLDPQTVALLFAADRADHSLRLIQPALARGAAVVCDRYLASSLAFQLVDGQGLIDRDWLLAINRAALVPDLSIWLDVPVATALTRIDQRGKPRERFEVGAVLDQVRSQYRQLFAAPPGQLGRTLVIPADRPRQEVARDVWAAVEQQLSSTGVIGHVERAP